MAFDWSDGPAVAVVSAVARELGVDPEDLDAPLHDYVDPDALDALFAPNFEGVPRSGGKVVLHVNGCEVTIRGSGEVSADLLTNRLTASGQADDSRTLN